MTKFRKLVAIPGDKHERMTYALQQKLYRFKREYGLNTEQARTVLGRIHGKCPICGLKPNSSLHVDHDHATGKMRGLVCANCNHLLGHAKDNVHTLLGAVKYLVDFIIRVKSNLRGIKRDFVSQSRLPRHLAPIRNSVYNCCPSLCRCPEAFHR